MSPSDRTSLARVIERGWASADADNPEPTMTYFRDLLDGDPDSARLSAELVG